MIRPRAHSSSRAATTSSPERPLAARTVSTSNVRPITAAAESTCAAVSETASSRASTASRTPAGVISGGRSEASSSARNRGRPSLSAYSVSAASAPSPWERASSATSARVSRSSVTRSPSLGQAGQRVPGVGLVGAAGCQQEQAAAVQPPGQIPERVERGRVAPVQVVDEHHARRLALACQRDQLADRLQEAQPDAGIVQAARRRRAQLREQPCGLGGAVRGHVGADMRRPRPAAAGRPPRRPDRARPATAGPTRSPPPAPAAPRAGRRPAGSCRRPTRPRSRPSCRRRRCPHAAPSGAAMGRRCRPAAAPARPSAAGTSATAGLRPSLTAW